MTSAARAAKNETFFREVNEQIRQLEETSFGNEDGRAAIFICECSVAHCTTKVEASLNEYRAVRTEPTHFLVAHGHVDPENERVVRSTDRHTVVEKFGLAEAIADRED
jgi:hypothetical protein